MMSARYAVAAFCAVLVSASIAHAQYTADGFNPGTNGHVRVIAVQPDGKVLIGGDFTMSGGGGTGGTTRAPLVRLNADGTVDAGFADSIPSPFPTVVYALLIQPDGKIIVGGQFTFFVGADHYIGVLRLNTDGTLDPTFQWEPLGSTVAVRALALQPDGRVLAAGQFNWSDPRSQSGFVAKNVCRLNADGTLDETFNPGGSDNGMWALALQSNGQVIVGGDFNMIGGANPSGETSRNYIARLNSNGSLDMGFNPGAGSPVRALATQPDDRILVGGGFFNLGGTTRRGIGRLETSGVVDATFNPGPSGGFVSATVLGIHVQTDGKILLGGQFDELSNAGVPVGRRNVGRVNANGTIDLTFDPGAGGNSTASINVLAQQADGKVLVGGTFATLGGGGSGNILRSNIGRVRQVATPAPLTELVTNGSFANGTANWIFFATPDNSYIVSSVNNSVLEFFRQPPPPDTGNQATAFQETGMGLNEFSPLVARFDIGNSSSVRKRISVLVLDSNFSDLSVCTFWLAPNAPMRTYGMKTHSTHVWANAAIYFYAATAGSDGGVYQVDNVSLQYDPAQSAERTDCLDPTAPVAPGGVAGPNLIVNGGFNGMTPWSTFGQIVHNTFLSVFNFFRPAGEPAGVVLQGTGQPMNAGDIITATFQLGTNLPVNQRVTVILHDGNFSDLSACTFWLRPGQINANYAMRTFATAPWSNAMFSVYGATVSPAGLGFIQLDDVTMQRTPGSTIPGTECIEPIGSSANATAELVQPGSGSTVAAGKVAPMPIGRIDPEAMTTDSVRVRSTIDLRGAESAVMTFESLLLIDADAAVEISLDGGDWQPIAAVPRRSQWTEVSVDLSAFVGQVVAIRFRATPAQPAEGSAGVWRIRNLKLNQHLGSVRQGGDRPTVRGLSHLLIRHYGTSR